MSFPLWQHYKSKRSDWRTEDRRSYEWWVMCTEQTVWGRTCLWIFSWFFLSFLRGWLRAVGGFCRLLWISVNAGFLCHPQKDLNNIRNVDVKKLYSSERKKNLIKVKTKISCSVFVGKGFLHMNKQNFLFSGPSCRYQVAVPVISHRGQRSTH